MSESDPMVKRQGRPKSEEKRLQILSAASCLFLKEGFSNTSMDKVAKASGVSKQTVYSHFSNKDDLFQSAISSKCMSYQLDNQHLVASGTPDLPFDTCLKKIGTQFMRLLQDPEVIAMFRVVIAESTTNPHVTKLFFDAGPLASLNTISDVFSLYGGSQLSPKDARQLACDFLAMLKGEFHIMSLCGLLPSMQDSELRQHVDDVVVKTVYLFEKFTSE